MRNLRKSPGPSLDAIVRELQIFNQRLKSGLIDTSTPEFAAAMTKVIQRQLLRLGDISKMAELISEQQIPGFPQSVGYPWYSGSKGTSPAEDILIRTNVGIKAPVKRLRSVPHDRVFLNPMLQPWP